MSDERIHEIISESFKKIDNDPPEAAYDAIKKALRAWQGNAEHAFRTFYMMKDDPDAANAAVQILKSLDLKLGKEDLPTTRDVLTKLMGKFEEATTDGDLSDIKQEDIGGVYLWLLWATEASA
jgi:hypothetical protein